MARQARVAVGGVVYHVINRSNGRIPIFETDSDYRHFETLLLEGVELVDMRLLAYCIMPNHWHLVLHPIRDRDLSEFMRWVTTTHVRQRRTRTKTVGGGHLYQGAYKSFPIEKDKHLIDVIRYVEQNPLRARLVETVEGWQWSSFFRRRRGLAEDRKLLSILPTELPENYCASVNEIIAPSRLELMRHSVSKGSPYGSDAWRSHMITKYNMDWTQRGPGRPKSG